MPAQELECRRDTGVEMDRKRSEEVNRERDNHAEHGRNAVRVWIPESARGGRDRSVAQSHNPKDADELGEK